MSDRDRKNDTDRKKRRSPEADSPAERKPGKPSSDSTEQKRKKHATLVWRKDRPIPRPQQEADSPPEAESGDTEKAPIRSGRKLFVRPGKGGAKKIEPPKGYEKHKDLTSYRIEEQDAQREQRRKRREEQRKKRLHNVRRHPKNVQPREKPEATEAAESVMEPIDVLYTYVFSSSNIQRSMQALVNKRIGLVIDLRSDEAMFRPGMMKDRDLAILLKEAAGIEYRREEKMVPRKETVVQYQRDKNLVRFRDNYLKQLKALRVASLLDRTAFIKHNVALIGEQADPELDQRGIAAQHLKELWNILNIVEI